MRFLQSRILVVVVGMIVVAGLSAAATAIASSPSWQTKLLSVVVPNSASTTTPLAGAGAHSATVTTTPTAPHATSTPVVEPTATNPPPSLRGKVTSVDPSAGQFVVAADGGAQVTVIVTDKTTFSGAASSMNALKTDLQVSVRGVPQTDGTFVATSVYSSIDN